MDSKSLSGYFLPIGFVLLYGSGFVFTQYGLQHSSPMMFLFIRFLIASVILCFIVFIFRIKLHFSIKKTLHIMFAGSLTVGTFSIGVYYSISYGVSASLSALIIALQPILVAFLALKLLDEKISKKIWIGLLLGFLGVGIVVYQKLSLDMDSFVGILWSFVGLLGLTFGSIYQKKFCSDMNLYVGGAIQTLTCAILVFPFLFFEESFIEFNNEFFIALAYMSIAVSIGALSLLYVMVKTKDISKVSAIFYMIPVNATLISYFFFKNSLDNSVLFGIGLVLISIILINRKEKSENAIYQK